MNAAHVILAETNVSDIGLRHMMLNAEEANRKAGRIPRSADHIAERQRTAREGLNNSFAKHSVT